MKKTTVTFIILALFLAACSSQTNPGANPQPTQAEAALPSSTTAVEPTQAESSAPPAITEAAPATGAGVTAYKIIPGESVLKYEVGEVFLNQNNAFNMAVGTTPQVSGEVVVDPAAPANSSLGTITADISQFTSDSDRRDNAIRGRFLESASYPDVTFTATSIEGLPETYQDGQEITFKIGGDLTIRDVTKPATFDVKAKLSGDTLSGEAVTTILMSDYGFGPISIAGILNTEDEAKVTLVFVARP